MAMTENGQTWVFHDEALAQDVGGGVVRRVLAFQDDLMLVENTFAPNTIGGDHSHPHSQISYVTEGVFTVHIAGEIRTAKQGDSVMIPGDVIHSCSSETGGVILDIFTPMRKDFV